MELNEKDIGLIEAFIDGSLSDEEMKAFQQRLHDDTGFAHLVQVRTELTTALKEANEYQQLKNQIGEVIQAEKRSLFQTYKYIILPIAATILILIGVYFVIQFQNKSNGDDIQLAEQVDSVSELKMDKPEKLAKFKTVDSITLLSPLNDEEIKSNESFQLKWKSASEQFGTLYVINNEQNKIVLEKKVRLNDNSYQINKNQLTQGEYKWYLNDTSNMGCFNIK